ncbi:MAG: hypothetical protein QXQ94_05045 [Candidatus Bathyarchaeia archaeon]
MKRKIKFWFFLIFGICLFTPFIFFSLLAKLFLYSLSFSTCFAVYLFFLYRFVYKKEKPKYPLVPPEGRMDAYFPRTNIPRPVHEDVRRYPEFFGKKKRKFDNAKKEKRKKR